jgi:hypothetical protein
MSYKRFLVLLSILLVIPIVKADGCGIVCPKNPNDLLTFSLSSLCNFFTWSFCHIFSFIIVAISGIVIFVFWHQQQDEKKKKIKLFLYALFGIFALVLFYPYIKAWTGMAISTTTTIVDYCTLSSHCNISANCGNSAEVTIEQQENPTSSIDYWNIDCGSGTAGVGFHLSFTSGSGTITPEDGYTEVPSYANVTSDGGNAYTLRLSCDSC